MPIVVNGTTLTDLKVGNTDITKVYARNGETGTYVIVFEKGGVVTVALWFGGNWKMNKIKSEIDDFFNTFNSAVELNPTKKVVIFPPACYLDYVKSKISASGLSDMISLGIQNISSEPTGAYTGQISAKQAADCGCSWAMVGGFEVREYLGVTDTDVNHSTQLAFSNGLKVFLCVGENSEIREAGTYANYAQNQLQSCLSGVSTSELENYKLVVVYEPIWAIGTGKTITNDQVREMIEDIIRPKLIELYGMEIADKIPVLMGGTANQRNIQGFISEGMANGGLISGASLQADRFASIINTTTTQ